MRLVSFILLMGMSVFASAQSADLKVVSKQPAGQLDNYVNVGDITVSFNQPVAALGEASQKEGAGCPIKISPSLAGTCRWLGTQTVVFTPKTAFAKATRYNVSIEKGFKSEVSGAELKKPEQWFFDTARPEVMQTFPYNNEGWLSLNPKLIIAFNMPVSMDSLRKTASLKEGGKAIGFKVLPVTDQLFEDNFKYDSISKDSVYIIEPASSLKRGADYSLTINIGLMALQGNLPLSQRKVINFRTYNDFNLAAAPESKCMPFTPSLYFSNPVSAGEVYKHISFEPALKITPKNEDDIGYESYAKIGAQRRKVYSVPLSGLEFEPSTSYKVTLNKDLKDIFGNKLGRDINFVWDNEGYCPAVTFKGGFGLIESDQKPYHPVTAVNAGSVPVEKQKIDYKNFIPFYQKNDNYCKKAVLEGDFLSSIWKPNEGNFNKPLSTFFDLSAVLEGKTAGIVFLQFQNPFLSSGREDCWQSSIDNITNIGLTIKTSPQNTLVWATYLDDAKPAKNKKVELRDYQNNLLWQGKTDKYGIAKAPGWEELPFKAEYSWQIPEVWAFAHDGDSVAVISNRWNSGIEPWRFNLSYNYSKEEGTLRTFLFTERDIYRQGEEVFIKGISRRFKDGLPTYVDIKKMGLVITDPSGKEVLNRDTDIESDSSFSYKYNIPLNAASGYWSIKASYGEQSFFSNFRVEAMKPAEFKVNLVSLSDLYIAGQDAVVKLGANYMFGAPLDNASVRWSAKVGNKNYTPQGFEDYSFVPCWQRNNTETKTILTAQGVLDQSGSGALNIAVPDITIPSALYVEAGVLSPQNQELFARKTITVLPADLLIGLKQKGTMIQVGETVTTEMLTVNSKGQKVDKHLTASLIKREYLSVRKSGVSGRLEWISEEKDTPLASVSLNTIDGKAKWDYVPDRAGYYLLSVQGNDDEGREITSGLSFYVSSDEEVYWQQKDDDTLEIALEKPSYKVGQKAKLLIKSPYKQATALVTVERQGILESFVEPVKGGAVILDIPIKEQYLPNVFVSVVLTQGRTAAPSEKENEDLAKPQAKFGYTSVSVAGEIRQLSTQIKTDKPKYQPGEKVNISIEVKDSKGKGRPASVTVFAVDEGVLALTAFKTPDIFNYFYAPEALSVSTADNRLYLIGQRNFGQKGENRGGGGSEDSKLGGIDLRSNFKFTPFYTASVTTDKKGKASASFNLPDNLTKFRIMAVVAAERDFGSAETIIEVAKPVMIKPVLPRFARLKDTFNCGFTVYNYTDTDNLILSLSQSLSGGIRFNEGGAVAVTLKAGESKNIMGSCTAYKMEDAVFKFAASGSAGSDGLEVKMPVKMPEQMQTLAEVSSTEGSQKQKLLKPSDIIKTDKNTVNISFSSSALLDLSGAVSYLLEYPYDCLEQQLSRISPIISGMDMITAFNLGDKQALEQKAKTILLSITDYQKADGGFGYWPESYKSDNYLTAYALDVLAKAKSKDFYTADAETVKKAVDYLNAQLSAKDGNGLVLPASSEVRAYAIYALAAQGVNVSGHFNNMAALSGLRPEVKVYLLKAAKVLGMTQAANKLRGELLNYAKQDTASIHFEADTKNYYFYNSDTMLTALVLDAMLSSGGFTNDYKAVTWLLSNKNKQGNWGNTFVNAAVFNALSSYYNLKEQKAPNFSAFLKADGKKIFESSFIGRSLDKKTESFTFGKFFGADAKTEADISKIGDGILYYNLAVNYYPASFKNSVSSGFGIQKNIRPLYDAKGGLVSGRRAAVDITVTTNQNRTFVVLEDFLPAGFEIIDTSLATESIADAGLVQGQQDYFNRIERYDDKLVAFADYLPAGTHKFTYIVQLVAAGKYSLPSAAVSQMYFPEVMGRTAGGEITVK